MMDIGVITTSLEALIQRATNPQNQNPDTAAIDAICKLINKEHDAASVGVHLMASKIQSPQEREALQALNVLDSCMKHCGTPFHSEVGKFRFLNEMIKVVSPKYLGSNTSTVVHKKIIELMYSWMQDYPRETKIREAFEMLRKQGVVTEEILQSLHQRGVESQKHKGNMFEDDEKSQLLRKLLQSKNPEDLQAANKLIKTMVREEERQTEKRSRQSSELESVQNNVRLLNEMLDSYIPGQASVEEVELMKELHQSCQRLLPVVLRLAADTRQTEDMLNQVLQVNDELIQVNEKYTAIIIDGKTYSKQMSRLPRAQCGLNEAMSLLDIDNLTEPSRKESSSSWGDSKDHKIKSNIDVLEDIFKSQPCQSFAEENSLMRSGSVLEPVSVLDQNGRVLTSLVDSMSKHKDSAKDDLDALGESLLKLNLPDSFRAGSQFKKTPDKIPMNLLKAQAENTNSNSVLQSQNSKLLLLSDDTELPSLLEVTNIEQGPPKLSHFDDIILSNIVNPINSISGNTIISEGTCERNLDSKSLLDLQINESKDAALKLTDLNSNKQVSDLHEQKVGTKALTDINVALETITPASTAPLTILDEKNSLTVVLHFAKDKPREDVSVIVITTMSKNNLPITNYLFQAVVPKSCKLKLQLPSSTELPAHNPFLPPAAITQVLLIANPNKVSVSLKFMISYIVDGDTISEMGEVHELPLQYGA